MGTLVYRHVRITSILWLFMAVVKDVVVYFFSEQEA